MATSNTHNAVNAEIPEDYGGINRPRFRPRNIPAEAGTGVRVSQATNYDAEFYEADQDADFNQIFLMVMGMLGDHPEPDKQTTLALYGAGISIIYPSLRDVTTRVLKLAGINLIPISLPSQAVQNAIQMPPTTISDTFVLVMLGQLILMAYKNLTSVNFDGYMRKRIRGMNAVIGNVMPENECFVTTSVVVANNIKACFGCNHEFRSMLIEKVIEGENLAAPFCNLFTYIGNILKYTDMSAFTFIADTLMYHRSPALRHPIVQSEIDSLADAFYVIARSERPQYFRIVARPTLGSLLERGRFPILLTVAQVVKKQMYSTIGQFNFPVPENHALVVELVNIHTTYMGHRIANPQRSALRFLAGFGPDADDQDDEDNVLHPVITGPRFEEIPNNAGT